MLYVLELQVELHYNEPIVYENETPEGVKFETTGSVKYINSMPNQTKIVDADTKELAQQKIENHYLVLFVENLLSGKWIQRLNYLHLSLLLFSL